MSEWYCTKCHGVVNCREPNECCGKVEVFDLNKHGRDLISGSNAWRTVYKEWNDNPLFKEVSAEETENGNYSAARILNTFVERLWEHYEHIEEPPVLPPKKSFTVHMKAVAGGKIKPLSDDEE